MRQYSFFILVTTLMVFAGNNANASSGKSKKSYAAEHMANTSASTDHEEKPMSLPSPANTHDKHVKKIAVPRSEELPHIHHFHKERVKKHKKHHKKYWALSQLILILCHIAILVIAYLHVTPH